MPNRSSLRCACLPGFLLLAASIAPAADFRITGPYTHDNLSVFLLHSPQNQAGTKLLTLQEAMEQQKVAVYETGQVNQLAIENRSAEDVYIQSGDIVKGGQQDRVLTTDLVLPAHSGRLPIASFCVEHGRWTRRGSEPAAQFSGSTLAVPSKSIKLAVREEKDQAKVWAGVDLVRSKLAVNSGAGLAGGVAGGVIAAPPSASPTSMQLAMENRNVVDATNAYVQGLAKIIDGKSDVVGYAYAINGKLNSAEVYSSRDLFRKMWPKLLRSSAAEAVAERSKDQAFAAPPVSGVKEALASGDGGREASKEGTGRVTVAKKVSGSVILFEARDRELGDNWIHKSYVVK